MAKGAALLRDQRQAAGLTLDDLGRALEVDDPSFMGLVEAGKVGLPLELILRLTAVLGRKDPVGFALQMTRVQPEDVEGAGGAQRGPTAGPGRARTRVRQHRQKPRWGRARSDADFAAALSFADAAFATALTSRPSGRRVRIEAPARRKAR